MPQSCSAGCLDQIDSGYSLFAFIDPFGLSIPFDQIESILARTGRRVGGYRTATEVLLNFSFPGSRRTAGHLTSTRTEPRSRDTIVQKLDSTLGGDWWQPIWIVGDPDRETRDLRGVPAPDRDVIGQVGPRAPGTPPSAAPSSWAAGLAARHPCVLQRPGS